MKQETRWTEPTIYPKNPSARDMAKPWRVRFDFYIGDKRHAISRKQANEEEGLNDILNFKERLAAASAMCKALKERLSKGWNPVTNTYPEPVANTLNVHRLSRLSFTEALDFGYKLKLKTWKGKSPKDYQSKVKYLKQAAIALGLDKDLIKEFRKAHFKLIMDEVERSRSIGPATYNGYLSALSGILEVTVEYDVIDANYAAQLVYKDEPKVEAHTPPDSEQRQKIVAEIKEKHLPYYRFLSLIYGCGIRPVEITRMKVSMFNKEEGAFLLPGEITKNGKAATVPIPNWVMELLEQLHLEKKEGDWYIFGSAPNMFTPGPEKIGTNAPNRYWRQIVKEGLKIKVDQYGLKKLSADDMIRLQMKEGIKDLLELPKQLFRHGNTGQTETYTQLHTQIFNEIIRDRMPEL